MKILQTMNLDLFKNGLINPVNINNKKNNVLLRKNCTVI